MPTAQKKRGPTKFSKAKQIKILHGEPWNLTDTENAIKALLESLGLDYRKDTHLKGTPERVAKMFVELTRGYNEPTFKVTTFPRGKNNQMIVQAGIPIYSLCAHHLVPFFGIAHIGYVPDKRIVGLSKLARAAEHFSRRFQVQEDLTQQITDFLKMKLKPLGVAVILECRHLCCEMRGVEKNGHLTITSALDGVFLKPTVRMEFLELIRRNGTRGEI